MMGRRCQDPVEMANGDGDRIGRIVKHFPVGEVEHGFDHILDLFLGCGTVSHHRLFDLAWGVFRCGNLIHHGRKDCDAPGMAKLQRRLGVLSVESRLDRKLVRMVDLDDRTELLIYPLEPERHGGGCRIADRSTSEKAKRISLAKDNPIAGHESARVNSKNNRASAGFSQAVAGLRGLASAITGFSR